MSHFHFSWHEVRHEISFKNLTLLSMSIPSYDSEKKESKTENTKGKVNMHDLIGNLPPAKPYKSE